MKKILRVALILSILLTISGCSKPSINEKDITVDEKLEDFDSIKEFILNNETFLSSYYEIQGEEFNYDNYELSHIDFTGDGKIDDVIVTYSDEEDFRPVIFISLENEVYQIYTTDFRAVKGTKFYMEDGFIVAKDNGYNRLAYNISDENMKYIRNTGASFSDGTEESSYFLNSEMKYKVINEIEKIDGYNDFDINSKSYFYDENGESHLVSNYIYKYRFNHESFQHDFEKSIIEENDLSEIMSSNLVIGDNNSLKNFKNNILENNSLKESIDYYFDNRKNFDRESRVKYINDTLNYISEISENVEFYVDEEIVSDSIIESVKIFGENPIPKNAEGIFKVVKVFYIEDGEAMNYYDVLNNGYYFISCIDPDYSEKIRKIKFDKCILEKMETGYVSRDDIYADVVFDTYENVYSKVKNIVYPTILVNDLNQIKEMEGLKFWKTNILIVPEEYEFL